MKRQTQTLPDDRFLRLVRAEASTSPTPPRDVSRGRMARFFYGRHNALNLVAVAVVGPTLLVSSFFVAGSTTAGWILRVVLGVGTVYLLALPATEGLRAARVTRDGLLTQATVNDARVRDGADGTARARGRRTVHHPELGDFRDEFIIVAPWADDVRAGSTLDVLVAPRKRETWLTLGVALRNSMTVAG